jgi:hypothetical protein
MRAASAGETGSGVGGGFVTTRVAFVAERFDFILGMELSRPRRTARPWFSNQRLPLT